MSHEDCSRALDQVSVAIEGAEEAIEVNYAESVLGKV